MTHLRKMMLEELERRNYSERTIRYYLRFVERFAQHFGKSPDKLGPEHLRSYQVYLLKERKLCPGSVEHHVAALRFFYLLTLHRPEFREFLPYPKVPRKLPNILSQEEVTRLIEASSSLFQRALLMVLYGTGMRRAEIARLKIADIDSQRMIIHVVDGKGHKDRDLPLSPALLETLRAYWRWLKPRIYLFPPACIAIASGPSATRRCGWPASRPRKGPVFVSPQARTWFATVMPHTYWKPVPTCVPSSFCSVMRIWRPRRGICIFPKSTCTRSSTPLKN